MNFKSTLLYLTAMLIGAGGGFAGGYYLAKSKEKERSDKEIASIRGMYLTYMKEKAAEEKVEKGPEESLGENKPQEIPETDDKKYVDYASAYGDPKETKEETPIGSGNKKSVKKEEPVPPKVEQPVNNGPYVISPTDFKTSDYEVQTLHYYSDKVLADDDGNIISNVVQVIGPEALDSFGIYSDTTVYVRDDKAEVDYEIIWEQDPYSGGGHIPGGVH